MGGREVLAALRAVRDSDLSASEKGLLNAIILRSDAKSGCCRTSVATLALDASIGLRTARVDLARLVRLRFIRRQRRRYQPSLLTMSLEELRKQVRPERAPNAHSGKGQNVQKAVFPERAPNAPILPLKTSPTAAGQQAAVRSLKDDAGLRPGQLAARWKGKEKLEDRLAATILRKDETLAALLSGFRQRSGQPYPSWWGEVLEGCEAARFALDESSPLVSAAFALALSDVHDKQREADLSPFVFCCKVLDYCERHKIVWPPSFQRHRDALRDAERRREQEGAA